MACQELATEPHPALTCLTTLIYFLSWHPEETEDEDEFEFEYDWGNDRGRRRNEQASQRNPDILEIFSLYSNDCFRSPIVIELELELELELVLGFFSVPGENSVAVNAKEVSVGQQRN
jgi:hypothetical protein